ncbi:MAG: hypothetical protein M1480_00200 [Bacteroidetes bacterium]|nr:hypothetical protein [Bacteroidota bacterium]
MIEIKRNACESIKTKAKRYNVTKMTIRFILNGETWRYVIVKTETIINKQMVKDFLPIPLF